MKLFYFIAIAILLYSCSKPASYTLTGNIEGLDDKEIIMYQWKGKYLPVDTVTAEKGKFEFNGYVEQPEQFYLKVKGEKGTLPVFIENSRITVTGTLAEFKNLKIKGSGTQSLYEEFTHSKDALFTKKLDDLNTQFSAAEKANDETKLEEIGQLYDSVQNAQSQYVLEFAKKNNSSVVSPFLILYTDGILGKVDNSEIKTVHQNFDPSIFGSAYYLELKKWISSQELVAIGQPFVEIAMPDTTGVIRSLFAFKGKWILLDFWSSKCGPCRKENPRMAELYIQYKPKGFEIFGVSFDSSKKEWQNAIATDGVNWTQVSALTGWDNEAKYLYCVEALPHSVLINPEGIIVEKNLRGDALQKKLKEIFN